MKRIRDTKACEAISATIILKEGKYIAKVLSHHSTSGVMIVEVWNEKGLVYQGKASGYGYDKFTAALSGAFIHDHLINDHCQVQLEQPIEGYFSPEFHPPSGFRRANYIEGKGWMNCYKTPGLDYLQEIGYEVINVL